MFMKFIEEYIFSSPSSPNIFLSFLLIFFILCYSYFLFLFIFLYLEYNLGPQKNLDLSIFIIIVETV